MHNDEDSPDKSMPISLPLKWQEQSIGEPPGNSIISNSRAFNNIPINGNISPQLEIPKENVDDAFLLPLEDRVQCYISFPSTHQGPGYMIPVCYISMEYVPLNAIRLKFPPLLFTTVPEEPALTYFAYKSTDEPPDKPIPPHYTTRHIRDPIIYVPVNYTPLNLAPIHHPCVTVGSTRHRLFTAQNIDEPPVTAESLGQIDPKHVLKELSVRHKLLLDPKLTFHPNEAKQMYRENYWFRLHNLSEIEPYRTIYFAMIRRLVHEIALIMIQLIDPFPEGRRAGYKWPTNVTEEVICKELDADLIHDQLVAGTLDIQSKFDFIVSTLGPLYPTLKEGIESLVNHGKQEYVSAFRFVLEVLEDLKCKCTSLSVQAFRPYVIANGPREEQIYVRDLIDEGEYDMSSVYEWLLETWKRLLNEEKCSNPKLGQVFRTGLLNLITDCASIKEALCIPEIEFPITFQYDKRQLTGSLHREFENLLIIAIYLLPYRYDAGQQATLVHIQELKDIYIQELKTAGINKESIAIYHLILRACHRVKAINESYDLFGKAKLWTAWFKSSLNETSPVFKTMYNQIRAALLNAMKKQKYEPSRTLIGLEAEMSSLSEKLILLSNYNFETYSFMYTEIVRSVQYELQK